MLDENADTTSDKEKMTNDVEMSLPTPPEIPMNIEEISNDENFEISNRPMILIKRIPLSEAENYLPDCYKTRWFQIFFCSFLRIEQQENLFFSAIKKRAKRRSRQSSFRSARRSKKRNSPKKVKPAADVPIISSSSSIILSDQTKKSRRKLRAIDGEDDDLSTLANLSVIETEQINDDCAPIARHIGQNGILSQTRKFQNHLNIEQEIERITVTNVNAANLEQISIFTTLDEESLFSSLDLTHDKTLHFDLMNDSINPFNYTSQIEDISQDPFESNVQVDGSSPSTR